MQRIRDKIAGRAISAYVVLKGARKVATVHVHHGSGGGVQVDIWQENEAAERSRAALLKAGGKLPPKPGEYMEALSLQQARAGGYGYDKVTACLSGMWIDGHKLTNRCGESLKKPRGKKYFPQGFKAPRGYRLANYATFQESTGARVDPWRPGTSEGPSMSGYADCYRLPGLDYLAAIGYRVIQVL